MKTPNKYLGLVLTLVSAAALTAHADGRSEARGWSQPWALLGVDGGYSNLDTPHSGELTKDGYQIGVKGLGAFYWRYWVLDIGGGWLFNRITGSESNASTKIRTRAGFAELSPRYRLSDKFSLGLVGQALFGTDLSFAPEERSTKSVVALGGVQAVYDINYDTTRLRFSLQATTDINVQSRQVYTILAGVQFGLPLTRSTAGYTPVTKTAKVVPEPTIKRVLDIEQLFHFKTASSDLRPDDRAILVKLGEHLAKNDSWDELSINGHTDERGTYAYNLGLSKRRAQAVRTALIAGGVSPDRLKIFGFSEARPLLKESTPVAWAKNRRVELVFRGLEDPNFIDSLIELKDKLIKEKNSR